MIFLQNDLYLLICLTILCLLCSCIKILECHIWPLGALCSLPPSLSTVPSWERKTVIAPALSWWEGSKDPLPFQALSQWSLFHGFLKGLDSQGSEVFCSCKSIGYLHSASKSWLLDVDLVSQLERCKRICKGTLYMSFLCQSGWQPWQWYWAGFCNYFKSFG